MPFLSITTELLPWAATIGAGGIAGSGLGWWLASRVRMSGSASDHNQEPLTRTPEATLCAALSAARAGIFEFDVHAKTVTGCAGFQSLFGLGENAPLELNDYLDRLHVEDREHLAGLVQQSLENKAGYFAEYRIVLPTGQERWVVCRAEPLFNPGGEVERFAGTLIDITERKQAEEALKESEQRFRSLFEQNIDGIFSMDLEGRFQNANPAALRISGYSLEELRQRRFTDLCAPDMLTDTEASFQSTVAGANQQMETALIRKDGLRVELLIRGTPIVVNGKVVGIFGVAEDITERKRAERALDENESRLQLALEAGQMGLWTLDLDNQEVTLDTANRHLFGMAEPRRAFPTEELFQRIHPDDVNMVRGRFEAMLAGDKDYSAEFRVQLPDGQVRWLTGRGRVVRDNTGKAVQVVGVNFDVTQHQVATEQLNLARIAAETASRAKDNFIATLSHELRTPLNPVLILASDQERNTGLPAQLRADFEMIRKNIELEANLIDDLLDLTRIAQGKLRLDSRIIDIQTLCRDAVEMLRADISTKGLEVAIECTATRRWISGDAVRLQQVFWNLLKNAVKFTPIGGQIRMELCDQGESSILIRIQDTGIGIDPGNLEKIFDAFEQGDPVINRRFGGLGLGLAISRTLVQMHGGRIWATSEGRDYGTCFHLEIPVVDPEDKPAPQISVPDQSPSPKRILLVEDDEATRLTLERLLTRRGHHLVAVSTTESARQEAAKGEFDVLISDLGLPDGNGHELMAQMRELQGLQGIALSGYGMEEDIARSHASGFAIHLTKPIDIKVLDRAIAQVSTPPTADLESPEHLPAA